MSAPTQTDPASPRRAAIYVSAHRVAGEARALAEQEAAATTHAQQHGYTVAGVYREEAHAGYDNTGPSLAQLIADAGSGAFEVVIVVSEDHLGRDATATEFVARQLADHGVTVETLA